MTLTLRPVRLTPGSDLRRALEDLACDEGPASAFVLSGIGSLRDARLRFAGEHVETSLPGDFEIVSLSGTLTRDGAHLHIAVADTSGRVLGGHLCYGNAVRTTAEVLLAGLPEWELSRAQDATTGYAELVVKRRGAADKDSA